MSKAAVEEFVSICRLIDSAYQTKSAKVQVTSLSSVTRSHLEIKVLSWRPLGL